jgi:predicted nucleic acid-binding protein
MVPIYALGGQSQARAECQAFLRSVLAGRVEAAASVEAIQELVHHRLRKTGDPAVALAAGRSFARAVDLLDFDVAVLHQALDLVGEQQIRGRDAIHAATALLHGIEIVVSYDQAFDQVPGLRRVTPEALQI